MYYLLGCLLVGMSESTFLIIRSAHWTADDASDSARGELLESISSSVLFR